VAPHSEYIDRLTKKTIAPVTTEQIYWGAVPFVIIQVIMVGLLIAFPGLVSTPDKAAAVNPANIQLEAAPAADQGAPADGKAETVEEKATREKEEEEEDPAKALLRSMNQDKK
jgi:GntP family gluconate:H+ symporter